MKKLTIHGILISALLAGAALPLAAQTSGNSGEPNQSPSQAQRKAMHQQMAAEIKAQDAELQQLVKQMNDAPEAKKADAVAAVVNKLVADRLAMHHEWENMRQQMRGTTAPPPEPGT